MSKYNTKAAGQARSGMCLAAQLLPAIGLGLVLAIATASASTTTGSSCSAQPSSARQGSMLFPINIDLNVQIGAKAFKIPTYLRKIPLTEYWPLNLRRSSRVTAVSAAPCLVTSSGRQWWSCSARRRGPRWEYLPLIGSQVTPSRQLTDTEKLRKVITELIETERTYVKVIMLTLTFGPLLANTLYSTSYCFFCFHDILWRLGFWTLFFSNSKINLSIKKHLNHDGVSKFLETLLQAWHFMRNWRLRRRPILNKVKVHSMDWRGHVAKVLLSFITLVN